MVSDRDLADGRGLAAKFVLKKGSTGKFRFNLVATNGQVEPSPVSPRVQVFGPAVSGARGRMALARGLCAWCDLPLDVAGVGGGPVAKIVVGVDASPGALRALAWAADEARMRLASLQVVHAYQAQALAAPLYFPSQEALPGGAVAAGASPPEEEVTETLEQRADFQEAVRRQAEDLLEGLLREMGETVEGIDVQRTVVEDHSPAEALVELSADADLLVVGSRGRGGFTSLLLGSVSHAAVLHALCPVVVIPSGAEDRKAAAPPRMARSEARP